MSWDDPTGAGMIGAVPGNAPVTNWDDDDDEVRKRLCGLGANAVEAFELITRGPALCVLADSRPPPSLPPPVYTPLPFHYLFWAGHWGHCGQRRAAGQGCMGRFLFGRGGSVSRGGAIVSFCLVPGLAGPVSFI